MLWGIEKKKYSTDKLVLYSDSLLPTFVKIALWKNKFLRLLRTYFFYLNVYITFIHVLHVVASVFLPTRKLSEALLINKSGFLHKGCLYNSEKNLSLQTFAY